MGLGSVLALFLPWSLVLSGYDIGARRLPNWLTLPGAVAVLTGAAAAGHAAPALAGGTALASVYLLIHLVNPAGLGAGDVKLAFGLGALTGLFGAATWMLAAAVAPLLTAALALAAKVMCGARTVPHGPSMCLASLAALTLVNTGSALPSNFSVPTIVT